MTSPSPNITYPQFNQLVRPLPRMQRWLGVGHLGNGLNVAKQMPHGYGIVKYVQDIGTFLLPKLVMQRSQTEGVEATFLEFTENLALYFGIGLLGKGLETLFKKLGTKATQMPSNNVIRAASILGVFGIITIGFEYGLSFVKNLLTLKVFRKSQFSDIVALSENAETTEHAKKTEQKAHRRLATCAALALGLLAASAAMVKRPQAKITQAFTQWVLPRFNFKVTDSIGANGEVIKTTYGLSPNLMNLFMSVAFVGYLDAARDGLERVETASRLLISMLSMAFVMERVNDWLLKKALEKDKSLAKWITVVDKKRPAFGEWIKAEALNFGKMLRGKTDWVRPKAIHAYQDYDLVQIHTVPEIKKALKTIGNPTELKTALSKAAPYLKLNAGIFWKSLAFAVILPGILNIGINQLWTRKRYERKEIKLGHLPPMQAYGGMPLRQLPRAHITGGLPRWFTPRHPAFQQAAAWPNAPQQNPWLTQVVPQMPTSAGLGKPPNPC